MNTETKIKEFLLGKIDIVEFRQEYDTKARIRQEFKTEKGYPCWVQSSEWPLGKDGKPMTYVKKGKRVGSKYCWIFRDESTGELTTVEQYD